MDQLREYNAIPEGNNGIATNIPNQEAYIARIENTMAAIEKQNLTHDRRYAELSLLKSRLTGKCLKKKLQLRI